MPGGVVGIGKKYIIPAPYRPYVWGFGGRTLTGSPLSGQGSVGIGNLSATAVGWGTIEDFEDGIADFTFFADLTEGYPEAWSVTVEQPAVGTRSLVYSSSEIYMFTALAPYALVHDLGYRFAVRRYAAGGETPIAFLFGMSGLMNGFGLFVDIAGWQVWGFRFQDTLFYTDTGPTVSVSFPQGNLVWVYVDIHSDGTLVYGQPENFVTWTSGIGLPGSATGWRYAGPSHDRSDSPRIDHLQVYSGFYLSP